MSDNNVDDKAGSLNSEEDTDVQEQKNVDRRSFFKVVGGGAIAAGVVSMCDSKPGETETSGKTGKSKKHGAMHKSHDVKPGELDDYYGFWSGGHAGDVRIVGVPSMRTMKRIAVFNVDPGSGYGITNETKKMMTGPFIGDTHHCHGSYKDGTYDGKYVWINDKANCRLARIRIDYMETDAILKIPNINGMHGTFPQRFPKTEWLVTNSEFQIPVPNKAISDAKQYSGLHTIVDAIKMKVVCQIILDENPDLAATDYKGKYSLSTSYNTEMGGTISEMLASDYDYLLVYNWARIKKLLKAGKYKMVNGVKILEGRKGKQGDIKKAIVLRIPVPKNPHGVNVSPDGKYAVCSGKVSPTCTVVSFDKIDLAFEGKIKPKDCIVAQPEVGLGPLHTTFDGRGNAITSIFIDSTNVKWNIDKAIANYGKKNNKDHIVDVLDIHYQVGHIMASMAETKEADGRWLVSLNKISKDRFINVGPLKPECEQLSDITGKKLNHVHDSPQYIEPHDCIIVRRDIIEPKVKHRHLMTEHPNYVTKSGVTRKGKNVTVKMTANAPVYGLSKVMLKLGDKVTLIITNHDEISDLSHGAALSNYGLQFVIAPFETKSVTFIADKPGVFWLYCTNFCHALHLEMRSRFIIEA